MCKILKKLHGRNADDILREYGNGMLPVDVVGIAKRIGIKLGSIDFSELEQIPIFKEEVEKSGNILGAVSISGEDVKIVYHNKLSNDTKFSYLAPSEKRDKLIRRQRFTIAHELAHCCLDMEIDDTYHIEYRREQKDYSTPKELNANIFAGEMLIPLKYLLLMCEALGSRVTLAKLSDIFVVSESVMRARLKYLTERGLFHNEYLGAN